jgi:uncharacterized membrane protein YdcZ (DUF606 family)
LDWSDLIGPAVVVLGAWLWNLRRRKREDPEVLEEESRQGWRMIGWITAAVVVLTVTLILAALGVPGAAVVAVAAFAVYGLLGLILPALPRRRHDEQPPT